jgi:hypothetical protein
MFLDHDLRLLIKNIKTANKSVRGGGYVTPIMEFTQP